MNLGFDNDTYLKLQSEHIRKRITQFGNKLYLEFGGKLFDDYHASRVLPGFQPDSKLKMLLQLKDQAEIIIAISADAIEKNKIRGDLGITYDMDVLRLIDAFRSKDLYVGSVVITQYAGQPAADHFRKRLSLLNIKSYLHYIIEGYPSNISHIVSDEGYGKNDYIETTRPLAVITAPGPGSGKMATCLFQLYMIDPFHLEAYGETTVNYNRDVEIFPVLSAIFEQILGSSPYKSPTDMGVNMAGKCIIDDAICQEACKQEIIRRYYQALYNVMGAKETVYKLELLMKQASITSEDRKVIPAAMMRQENTGHPAAAIQLPDGRIITGKTSDLLGASAAVLLNALKTLGGIDHALHLVSRAAIEPIQTLKTDYLGSRNPRLHTDEILIALSISAASDDAAKLALAQLPKLKGCEVHSTVILSSVDEKTFRRLGMHLTCEPAYETNTMFH